MREITIQAMKNGRYLISEPGVGQHVLESHFLKHRLNMAGHTGRDYDNTKKILNKIGYTTVIIIK